MKNKENRKIPELVTNQFDDETSFESSDTLETENYTCFVITKKDSRSLALKVLFSNGGMALIQYSRMMSPITFNGSNEIKIDTPTLRLEIKGSFLIPLIDYLAEHRLAWITSSGVDSFSESIMMKKGEPEIKAIQIKSKSKEKKDAT